ETRRPLARLPRLPPFCATRSTVLGVDRGNLAQPPSSGPAVALLLNHTSCTVTHTWEYRAGALPVSDTSVFVEQAASTPPNPQTAARSAICRRGVVPIPVRCLSGSCYEGRSGRNAADPHACFKLSPRVPAPNFPQGQRIGRGGAKAVPGAPPNGQATVSDRLHAR